MYILYSEHVHVKCAHMNDKAIKAYAYMLEEHLTNLLCKTCHKVLRVRRGREREGKGEGEEEIKGGGKKEGGREREEEGAYLAI